MTEGFEVDSGHSREDMDHKILDSPPRVVIADRTSEFDDSPAKLAPNHSIFMASINKGSPASKKNGESGSGKEVLTPRQNGSMSSTRVIESLHDQIDTLTSTNLQLTVQSKNLLDKLDAAQQKESKLLENSASLKHENENLVSMLNRKTRRLKDVEEELIKYKESQSSLIEEKTALQKKWENSSSEEMVLRQQMEMVRAQYDALMDSHRYYKSHYGSQISTLNEQLENLKVEQRNHAQRVCEKANTLDVKLLEFDSKYDNLQHLEEARMKYLESKCNDLSKQLDLPSWTNLYRESKTMALDFAEKMKLIVPADFQKLIEEPELVALEAKTQPNNACALPLRMAKSRGTAVNGQQQGTPGSNMTHAKRSSFYGGMASSPASSLPGTLPGVRRSSSRRKASSRVASTESASSSDSSPVFPPPSTTPKNVASSSPRLPSTHAFNNYHRKKHEGTSVSQS